jgi:hypothetical protein
MANYLKGIGDALTRSNEILPSFDARINNFLCGHTAGIIKGDYNEFAGNAIDRGVIIKSGMMQAYGFFGCTDTETQINFIMPSMTNYFHIYAEIDLSIVPNRFEVKATALSNTSAWSPRQDDLKIYPNGKYQFPLWMITLTASTIILTDRRAFIEKPLKAVNADNATKATSADSATNAGYATTAGTANALSDSLNATIDGTYVKIRRLHNGDTSMSAFALSGNASYTISTPSSDADTVVIQGMLTCANKYWVTLTMRRGSFLGYGQDTPALYWFRSVNGQTNISYGFMSLEASLSGNSLSISGWKINQANNNYSSSHERASACYFALHSVFEIVNSNK